VVAAGTSTNPFRYIGSAGVYYDVDMAAYYMRAREYTPIYGRFLTVDPFPVFQYAYTYANYNPVNQRDPSGLFGIAGCGIGGLFGGIGGIGGGWRSIACGVLSGCLGGAVTELLVEAFPASAIIAGCVGGFVSGLANDLCQGTSGSCLAICGVFDIAIGTFVGCIGGGAYSGRQQLVTALVGLINSAFGTACAIEIQ
jgi:RHS repeat-associated protein